MGRKIGRMTAAAGPANLFDVGLQKKMKKNKYKKKNKKEKRKTKQNKTKHPRRRPGLKL